MMTNDAKLGLVVGIGLVILIAIVFFRKDAVPTAVAPIAPAPVQTAKAPARSGGESLAVPQLPPPFDPPPLSPIEPIR
jgi:hypothetical protein